MSSIGNGALYMKRLLYVQCIVKQTANRLNNYIFIFTMVPSRHISLYIKYVLHMHYAMFYIFCLAHSGIYAMFIDSFIFHSMAI